MVNRRPDPARETALTEALNAAHTWLNQQPDPVQARAIFSVGFVECWDTHINPTPQQRQEHRR